MTVAVKQSISEVILKVYISSSSEPTLRFKMIRCGGTSDVKEATEETQAICDQIRGALEEKTGKKFQNFKAVSYKSQVVAGTNYFIKIECDGEHIHVRVFQSLPHAGSTREMHSYQEGKTVQDEIEYF